MNIPYSSHTFDWNWTRWFNKSYWKTI